MMRRILAALLGLFVMVCASQAQAQLACTPMTQPQLLASFADNVPPGSITPRTIRNFVCSTPNQSQLLNISNNGGQFIYGTSLYPIYQTSISTNITITNSSTSFRAPSGLSINLPNGSTPGDTIYATDIPLCNGFRSSVVTYDPVSGNGTMTCAASATTTEAVRFGDGVRFDPNSTVLANTIGAQNLKAGDAATYRTWWPTTNPGYGANLTNQGASLEVGSNVGNIISEMVVTHSLDAATGHSIALDIHTLADATSGSHSLWGIYDQVDTVGALSAFNTGTTAGEIEIANHWSTVVADPFTLPTNNTVDFSFGSGAGEGGTNMWGTLNPATAAMYVFANGSTFESGIVFSNGSLDKTQAGAFAPAVAMGDHQSLSFYGASGQQAWNIYSTGANATNTGNLIFGAATVTLNNAAALTFDVESEGAGQSRIEINTGTAGQDATTQYADAGTFEWKAGKRGSDLAYEIFDITNSANALLVSTAGVTTLGETIGNSIIQGTAVLLDTAGGKQAQVNNTATAVDFLTLTGSAAGSPGIVGIGASGTDTDISISLTPKGAGTIVAAGPIKLASSTTGAGTQTFTNSPCSGLTSERWIPYQITGQTGTWYIPACQ